MERRSFVWGVTAVLSACGPPRPRVYPPEADAVDRDVYVAAPSRPEDPSPWQRFILGDLNIERNSDGALVITSATESAVSQMMLKRNLGYDRSAFLTERVAYGAGFIDGRRSPQTMCVGAVYEVLLRAINLASTAPEFSVGPTLLPIARVDSAVFRFWMFSNPFGHFPGALNDRQFGVVLVHANGRRESLPDRTKSNGAADTFATFGIGGRVAFADALPGDFISFNRTGNRGGHAAIIVRFIDSAGGYSLAASENTVGVLYFSAQGSTSGLEFREEYFAGANEDLCRRTSAGGCTVISADDGELLSVGRLWHPSKWVTNEESHRWRYEEIQEGRVSIAEAQELNEMGYGWIPQQLTDTGPPPNYDDDNASLAELDPTAGLNIY